ncbi:hypothetical protein [Candidatus Enterococcus ikei]|uniref:Integral membrane protein n=1 Tax=Candidatus Enterococcus ikei TaxID=2815326 RepID=A0ABS3H579_9ENTE|nr:hypothetical protein [Enterococcus sp. DIV0869a]MBO0441849.1 hypothetical protein [Enterococcus sp. DIV0869a]
MEKIKIAINSLMGSIILTAVLMTVNFLIVLFSSSDDGTRKIFFNTLFFKSVTDSFGKTTMSFGLTQNYQPLIIVILALFAILYFSQVTYKVLLERKKKLTNDF